MMLPFSVVFKFGRSVMYVKQACEYIKFQDLHKVHLALCHGVGLIVWITSAIEKTKALMKCDWRPLYLPTQEQSFG